MQDKYPQNVLEDLEAGFKMTDEDDGFQRYRKLSDSVFQYRCDYDDETFDEIIDTDSIDKFQAICGFYDSVDSVIDEFGADANMMFAECEFEHRVSTR